MRNLYRKTRGVSPVIAVILLIALTMVAIVLIWLVVQSVINQTQTANLSLTGVQFESQNSFTLTVDNIGGTKSAVITKIHVERAGGVSSVVDNSALWGGDSVVEAGAKRTITVSSPASSASSAFPSFISGNNYVFSVEYRTDGGSSEIITDTVSATYSA